MTTTESSKIRSFWSVSESLNFKIFFNHGEGMTTTESSTIRPFWSVSESQVSKFSSTMVNYFLGNVNNNRLKLL